VAVAGAAAIDRATALAGALLLATVGCWSPDATPTVTSSSRPCAAAPDVVGLADWPTYHHNNARFGVAPQMSPVGSALGVGWRAVLYEALYERFVSDRSAGLCRGGAWIGSDAYRLFRGTHRPPQ